MFLQITGFILLVLFSAGAVCGVRILRQLAAAASKRAELDAVKVDAVLRSTKHDIVIQEHQRGLQMLALTQGDTKTEVEKAAQEIADRPEEVKPDGAVHPAWKYEEGIHNMKLRRDAVAADFDPIT